MSTSRGVVDHAAHTPFTDPGRHASLIAGAPTDLDRLSDVLRGLVGHYRAEADWLDPANVEDIHSCFVATMLDVDAARHGLPLAEPRPGEQRLQGCCRDHTLLAVSVLRQHGVPARSRVGFAGYFIPDFHVDHVIPEFWDGDHWRRFDPELDTPRPGVPDPRDMPQSPADGTGFTSAAEVWSAHRRGDVDATRYGVAPGLPDLAGPAFIAGYVICEVAHRFGDELLLWHLWGAIPEPGAALDDDVAHLADEVAEALLAADAGDLDAERALLRRYRGDDRLHPADAVLRASPLTGEVVEQRLR